MARIAFFTESLPPAGDVIGRFSWDLIQSLADQQHEIRVLSTYRGNGQELPNKHSRIEILRPFKKWSLLELPKILPQLLQFQPEIMHIIQPHQEALGGFTNAMELVPGFKSFLGRPICVASFFDLPKESLRRHRILLSQTEAITVSNDQQSELLKSFYTGRKKPLVEIVPLGFAAHIHGTSREEIIVDESFDSESNSLDRLSAQFPDVVAVAGPIESHVRPLEAFDAIASSLKLSPKACVVILGGWGQFPIRLRHQCEEVLFAAGVEKRVLLTGILSEDAEARFLRRSKCVLAAPVAESRLAFMRFLRNAQRESTPVILSVEQANLDPISWVDGENALVRARLSRELGEAVQHLLSDHDLRERLRRNMTEFSRKAVADQPGNLVSRLYVRALNPA